MQQAGRVTYLHPVHLVLVGPDEHRGRKRKRQALAQIRVLLAQPFNSLEKKNKKNKENSAQSDPQGQGRKDEKKRKASLYLLGTKRRFDLKPLQYCHDLKK